jgi:hypothetical protein
MFRSFTIAAALAAVLALSATAFAEEALTGKKIYEIDLDITGTTDYGVTMDAITSGKAKVPLQGAQFDVAFVGTSKGVVAGIRLPQPPGHNAVTRLQTGATHGQP